MKPKQLAEVRNLLSNPSRWDPRCNARSKDGMECPVLSSRAISWSVRGAVEKVLNKPNVSCKDLTDKAKALGYHSIPDLERRGGHTKVMELLSEPHNLAPTQ